MENHGDDRIDLAYTVKIMWEQYGIRDVYQTPDIEQSLWW